MRAILIGATGLTGGLLLEELLKDPVFTHIKLISRRTAGIQNERLEELLVDFDNAARFKQALTQADVLFCCVGTTRKKVKGDKNAYRKIDFDIPVQAAKYCAEQNTPKFILVSSVGANAAAKNFYLSLKGETENAIQQLPFEALYIMRPSILLGKRNEFRLLEWAGKTAMRFFSLLLVGGLSKYRAIEAGTLARAMLAAAKQRDKGIFICHYREINVLANAK